MTTRGRSQHAIGVGGGKDGKVGGAEVTTGREKRSKRGKRIFSLSHGALPKVVRVMPKLRVTMEQPCGQPKQRRMMVITPFSGQMLKPTNIWKKVGR